MSVTAAYEWREADPEFFRLWKDAEKTSNSLLEDEALRRAVQGCDRPVFQGGIKVGAVREYSDTLLQFLLRARDPSKYRDNLTIEHGGEIKTGMTEAQIDARIAQLLAATRAPGAPRGEGEAPVED
jgi:hypothetical protein